ncbi:MAG: D-alanyl-D-alanine carboxypeptidase family protein [Nitrospirota bacterium]
MHETGAKGVSRIRGLFLVPLALVLMHTAQAQGAVHPMKVGFRAAVLLDANSGQFLYAQNPHLSIPPASLTKVLTLFLTFDAIQQGRVRLSDEVPISRKAWRTSGSKMFVKAGERVSLEELIKGIAVDSGNDASVAVAEYLEGSERAFVAKMNNKLRELNIRNTRIETVHGLPARKQYTTAADMALLARAYIQAHPESLHYHQLTSFTYRNISQHNRNRLLLQDPSVDGLKTGYTRKSGYHLVATARRGDQRLIAVVLDARNRKIREREAMRLLNLGFQQNAQTSPGQHGEVQLAPALNPVPPVKSGRGSRARGV